MFEFPKSEDFPSIEYRCVSDGQTSAGVPEIGRPLLHRRVLTEFSRIVVRLNPSTELAGIRPADASVEGASFSFYGRFLSVDRFGWNLSVRDFTDSEPP